MSSQKDFDFSNLHFASFWKKILPTDLNTPADSAMLQDLQKTHKQFRNLEGLVLGLIRVEYEK